MDEWTPSDEFMEKVLHYHGPRSLSKDDLIVLTDLILQAAVELGDFVPRSRLEQHGEFVDPDTEEFFTTYRILPAPEGAE